MTTRSWSRKTGPSCAVDEIHASLDPAGLTNRNNEIQ